MAKDGEDGEVGKVLHIATALQLCRTNKLEGLPLKFNVDQARGVVPPVNQPRGANADNLNFWQMWKRWDDMLPLASLRH